MIIVLACLSVQGCLRSYFEQKEAERKAEKNKVPETKARFHINEVEYYREDTYNWTTTWVKGFNIYCESGNQYGIVAYIRSVGANNTKGDDQTSIYIHFPMSLLFEGSVIKDRGWFCLGGKASEMRIRYGVDADYISNAHLSHGDFFEVTIPKFDGFEVGDSIRINFKFKSVQLAG